MIVVTFGGRGRAPHAPYPQMWPPTTAIPRDPSEFPGDGVWYHSAKSLKIRTGQGEAPFFRELALGG